MYIKFIEFTSHLIVRFELKPNNKDIKLIRSNKHASTAPTLKPNRDHLKHFSHEKTRYFIFTRKRYILNKLETWWHGLIKIFVSQ